jgi:enoyl-CoA hydratase/carnithine racemase
MSARVTVRLVEDGITEIELGDGRARNALATADWLMLAAAVDSLGARRETRAVIVRGKGATFCSGYDITAWAGASDDEVEASFAAMERACTAIENLDVPVIAAVAGHAIGGGLMLALACDLRVLSSTVRLGMPIARLGILVPDGFARRLVNAVGVSLAREMLLTGSLIEADEARMMGIGRHVVAPPELDLEVLRIARRLLDQPPSALGLAKAVLAGRAGSRAAVDRAAFDRGIRTFMRLVSSADSARPPRGLACGG